MYSAWALNYRATAERRSCASRGAGPLSQGHQRRIAAGEPIRLPQAGPDRVDYEAELAVVIGKRAKNLSPAEAFDHILGYTCANDVSARDWQIEKQQKQWARGKSFDTFCPLGPCLVTRDGGIDPNRLQVRSLLNGRILQDANSSEMIFTIQELVSGLSQSFTLLPGTVILTGTPEGWASPPQPPVYLREGDEITVEVRGSAASTNPVLREEIP
jgi:2-keto-4-pentenoate hydratase/2-oxohepta-3-ene-1,7-dioic acid hydratase in catechol pathway